MAAHKIGPSSDASRAVISRRMRFTMPFSFAVAVVAAATAIPKPPPTLLPPLLEPPAGAVLLANGVGAPPPDSVSVLPLTPLPPAEGDGDVPCNPVCCCCCRRAQPSLPT